MQDCLVSHLCDLSFLILLLWFQVRDSVVPLLSIWLVTTPCLITLGFLHLWSGEHGPKNITLFPRRQSAHNGGLYLSQVRLELLTIVPIRQISIHSISSHFIIVCSHDRIQAPDHLFHLFAFRITSFTKKITHVLSNKVDSDDPRNEFANKRVSENSLIWI